METAIAIVWTIGLLVAVLLTLTILLEVAHVIRALRDIRGLSELTREAALGLREETRAVATLKAASDRAEELVRAVERVRSATDRLAASSGTARS